MKHSILLSLLFFSWLAFGQAPVATQSIYINGGYNASSNYSVHEDDLNVFKNSLFSKTGPAKLFNAGGKDSPVLYVQKDGTFERDDAGNVITRPTGIKDAEMASKEQITKYFKKLSAKNPPRAVTVVWGDHGGPDGVALWDDGSFSPDEIKSMYKQLPKTTNVRAIHIHCYSGEAMSGPDEVMPVNDKKSMKVFIDRKYPSNVCALGLSDNDEVGQYRHWHLPDNPWKADLEKTPISLSILKERLLSDKELYPTIMLTSDYYLRDLKNGICGKSTVKQSGAACSEKNAVTSLNSSTAKILEKLPNLCNYVESDAKSLDDFAAVNSEYDEVSSLKSMIKGEILQEKNPEFYKNFVAAYTKMDEIKQKIAKETNPKALKKLTSELAAARADYPHRYSMMALGISESSPDYVERLNKMVNSAWLEKNKEQYPGISKSFPAYEKEQSSSSPKFSDYCTFINEKRDRLALERSRLAEKMNSERRAIFNTLFSDPKYSLLKERYESIIKCEQSSLN